MDLAKKIINKLEKETAKYKTVVVDSITSLSTVLLAEEMKQRPGKSQRDSMFGYEVAHLKDYGVAIGFFKHLIESILALEVENIIFIGHLYVYKNEDTGMIKNQIQTFGAQLRDWIPTPFQEVYRVHTKMEMGKLKRLIQTQPSHLYISRTQSSKLPNNLDITSGYSAIKGYL